MIFYIYNCHIIILYSCETEYMNYIANKTVLAYELNVLSD